MSPTSSPRHASHARRKQGHRRQLSDPKLIAALSPLNDDSLKAEWERVSGGYGVVVVVGEVGILWEEVEAALR